MNKSIILILCLLFKAIFMPSLSHAFHYHCTNGELTETELEIRQEANRIFTLLESKNLNADEIKENLTDESGAPINLKAFQTQESPSESSLSQKDKIKKKLSDLNLKVLFFKYIRKQGLKIPIKVPLDLNLTQSVLDKFINNHGIDFKSKFEIEYQIEIKPDLKTGDIFRDDSIVFTPLLRGSDVVKNVNLSGQLSTSYIYTLSRKYKGALSTETTNSRLKNEDIISPITKILNQHPLFFKPRCGQSYGSMIINANDNLIIPTDFDKLDHLLLHEDTLTYQKKSVINSSISSSNFNSFLSLNTGIRKGRIVSFNKIIHKRVDPYPVYHMKTFLDSTDIEFEGRLTLTTGLYDNEIVSWRQLDKLLKRPLRKKLVDIRLSEQENLTYLTSFYFSLDEPKFAKIGHHIEVIKKIYNELVQQYFVPSWSHLKTTAPILFDLRDHENRKHYLDRVLNEIMLPLFRVASDSITLVNRENIKTRKIKTPNCEEIELYPITKYFNATKDLKREYFNFEINLLNLAGMKYNENWENRFYRFQNNDNTYGYYNQSIIDTNEVSRNIFTRQVKNKQLYAITESTLNNNILKFKTLGFTNEISDTDFFKWNDRNFKDEMFKIIPFGKKSKEIQEKYNLLSPYLRNKEVYLGYKYLLSAKGFEQISKKVTEEVVHKNNFDFVYEILKQCMTKKDPNYNNSLACISHIDAFNIYERSKLEGVDLKEQEKASLPLKANVNTVDFAIKSIAQKITLIFLDNEHFYSVVQKQSPSVRKLVYKSNLVNVFDTPKYKTINNAKFSIFNSLVSLGINSPKVTFDEASLNINSDRQVPAALKKGRSIPQARQHKIKHNKNFSGEQQIFKDIASIALPYILYYSFDKSNYKTFNIDSDEIARIDDFMYVFAIFRSTLYNKEEIIQPESVIDQETFQVLSKINFFEFSFDNVMNMSLTCQKDSSDQKLIDLNTMGLATSSSEQDVDEPTPRLQLQESP